MDLDRLMYHGVSIRDAAMMCGVPEQNVRRWLQRGKVSRMPDGRVDAEALQKWWDHERHKGKGSRAEKYRARYNPYDVSLAVTSRDR